MALDAIILVGGAGTRLRPLTTNVPKAMVPLMDKPLLSYGLAHLSKHGVRRVVLACGSGADTISAFYGDVCDGIALEYAVEDEPLGTGGALALACGGLSDPFLVLNGDSICSAELSELVDFHNERGAKATIALASAPDSARYGFVRTDTDGRIREFVEKPQPGEKGSDLVSSGVYVLRREALEQLRDQGAASIERDVFPTLVDEGSLYGLELPGYWLDVGTLGSYLQAHRDILARAFDGGIYGSESSLVHPTARVAEDAQLIPPVYVGADAIIEGAACVGPMAVIGAGTRVGLRSTIADTVLQPGARIGDDCLLTNTIVGSRATVGDRVTLTAASVVGPGGTVPKDMTLAHAHVEADTCATHAERSSQGQAG